MPLSTVSAALSSPSVKPCATSRPSTPRSRAAFEVTVQAPAGGPSRLLRPAEVLPLVGRRSLSSLARLRREDETFLAPVRVPGTRRAIAWREADVVAWRAAREAERRTA